ncbi:unnamed protein product [Leptosia nina]|uniref:Organic cation transporter n=1 Tax=Leptosia nina TaxID=320188 RepID=A0AAV1K399_9NEOP
MANTAPVDARSHALDDSVGSGPAVSAVNVDEDKWGDPLEALLARLGPFGFYQRYVLFLLMIPNLLAPMYSLNYIFIADRVPFRCVVPECEYDGRPQVHNASVAQLLSQDECRRRKPLQLDRPTCEPFHYHPEDTLPCRQFVYETQDTIFAEFGLACEEWRRTLVGTVRNAALPIALLLTGYISDGWGRRTAFCVFSAFAGALGLVKSYASNYGVYLALEFFEAALGYGFNSAAYVMMVELARPSLRATFACASGVAYALGGVLLAETARRVSYWRHLLRVLHTPALALPFYWLVLDETVRWLHAADRIDAAVAVVKKAARWNKVVLEEDFIRDSMEFKEDTNKKKAEGNACFNLTRSRVLVLRFAACSFCWVAAAFVYYGLTVNSTALSGDKYTNFALNMAMEIVASLLIMMALERIGRKISIAVAFLLCAAVSGLPLFIGSEMKRTHRWSQFAGKLFITFAFNSLYVFTAEMFPTSARSSALAAVSLVGRIGSILAPQTPLLSETFRALLYCGVSLCATAAVVLVPETRRAALPQLAHHAERLRCASIRRQKRQRS